MICNYYRTRSRSGTECTLHYTESVITISFDYRTCVFTDRYDPPVIDVLGAQAIQQQIAAVCRSMNLRRCDMSYWSQRSAVDFEISPHVLLYACFVWTFDFGWCRFDFRLVIKTQHNGIALLPVKYQCRWQYFVSGSSFWARTNKTPRYRSDRNRVGVQTDQIIIMIIITIILIILIIIIVIICGRVTRAFVRRYIAVTQPIKYAKHKNNRRVWLTIVLVWAISAAIGSPIVLGLNNTPDRTPDLCLFYNSNFIIYSSLSSFYIPCIIMVFLYWNIFKVSGRRVRVFLNFPSFRTPRTANAIDIKKYLNVFFFFFLPYH